jgi:uncharacterized protein (TIGR03437 family)
MLRLWSALAAMAASAAAQNAVVTYQYDNSRAGFNPRELALTKSNVTSSQFGKLFSYKVDGYLYAQPVYLPGVRIPGKGLHNVVYAVTEHDSVYAFDADSGGGASSAPLWHVSFLNSAAGVTSVPATDTNCGQIAPEIGITSTPVIDLAAGTIYVVAMTKESSSYIHRLHALDAATGAERPGSPVTIQATFPGTGEGGATVTFNAKNYKQRPGLLLLNGVVYTAWSSHCDIGTYHGWLIGYDAQTLRQVSVYNNTPNGNEGSFWHGGAAPAADAAGNIFVVSGNGTFNTSGSDLGESYIKLSSAGGLTVSDFFTPYNYSSLNNSDLDTGSAGVALLPDEAGSAAHPHLMVGAGKEGRIYLLDRDNLGKWRSGSDNQIVQSIPGAIGGLFGNPAYFGKMVYFCGSGDNLKAFPISGGQMATAPASKSAGRFGFPGCLPTVSANGTSNGIVWILETAGILHAYDAANLATELYNSNQNASRDSLGAYVKFSVPMVVNGKVYAGSQAALNVYGLLATGGVFSLVSAEGVNTATAAGSIISLYGATTLPGGQADAYPLPPSLNGVAVTVNGQLAPLYYAGPGQINAQIPVDLPVGNAAVAIMANGVTVGTATVAIQAVSPGLFTLAENRAAALNADYSINSQTAPASAGSVISAYLTGLGATDNPVATGAAASSNPLSHVLATVTATVGGQPAEVQFAGLASGYGGLYQVNLVIPQLSPGDYPLQVSAGGLTSNTALVSVR